MWSILSTAEPEPVEGIAVVVASAFDYGRSVRAQATTTSDNYHRINTKFEPKKTIALDDWRQSAEIIQIGKNYDISESEKWLKKFWN